MLFNMFLDRCLIRWKSNAHLLIMMGAYGTPFAAHSFVIRSFTFRHTSRTLHKQNTRQRCWSSSNTFYMLKIRSNTNFITQNQNNSIQVASFGLCLLPLSFWVGRSRTFTVLGTSFYFSFISTSVLTLISNLLEYNAWRCKLVLQLIMLC